MTFTRQTSPHGSLVALSTMKDEGPTVVEWVAHHLAVGFTELMVYTNAARPWWRKNPPLKGSYIARMCEKLDIDPTAALEE